MEEEHVTFPTAKLAHEKGFCWEQQFLDNADGKLRIKAIEGVKPPLRGHNNCYNKEGQPISPKLFNTKNEHIARPTQSLLQKWLREVHKIEMFVMAGGGYRCDKYYNCVIPACYTERGEGKSTKPVNTYEEALEEGLKFALSLIEIKK